LETLTINYLSPLLKKLPIHSGQQIFHIVSDCGSQWEIVG